ncbi:MAG: hypothetical protein M3Y60_07945 [Bacteroidota bacterium]|nr:hypothetical protein [Bacteroidota bacterium]
MDKQKDPQITPNDLLKAENAFLKLKLGLEHGMQMEESSTLSPEIENQWLKSVYAFEQQYKDAKRIKVYDYIGRPPFTKWHRLDARKIRQELERLRSVMSRNSIELDSICEYDDATIYRFVTEELFEHEMDDMRIPGMTCHYTYEEFHPNHDYDLRRETTDFLNSLFTKVWNEDYDAISLANNVAFRGKEHSRKSVSSIVTAFQEVHRPLQIKTLDITDVTIHSGLINANVRASVDICGEMKSGEAVRYTGVCSFSFIRDDNFWQISGFFVPGF